MRRSNPAAQHRLLRLDRHAAKRRLAMTKGNDSAGAMETWANSFFLAGIPLRRSCWIHGGDVLAGQAFTVKTRPGRHHASKLGGPAPD
jgi:hypothetical protein